MPRAVPSQADQTIASLGGSTTFGVEAAAPHCRIEEIAPRRARGARGRACRRPRPDVQGRAPRPTAAEPRGLLRALLLPGRSGPCPRARRQRATEEESVQAVRRSPFGKWMTVPGPPRTLPLALEACLALEPARTRGR